MKKILFITFDYPPSSAPGALRSKVICQTLVENDIAPIVLTSKSNKLIEKRHSKSSIRVERVKSIDALKLLSIRGRSLSWFALPDRWWPWTITGYKKGLSIINTNNIGLIMVTIPTYSAGVMSLLLSKKSGLPLIVDLRDPFRFRYDPENVPAHFLFQWIERLLLTKAERVITTTKECAHYYSQLYPQIDPSRFVHIANGFDEDIFATLPSGSIKKEKKFILLHSGTLYSIGRDPQALLFAISLLKKQKVICSTTFQLVVRGSPAWPNLEKHIKQLNLEKLVIFKEANSYNESLIEMKQASALVIIQGDIFKTQIPSKLYDYLACSKPILVMSKPEGATGKEAIKMGLKDVSDTPEILAVMLEKIIKGKGTIVTDFSQESRQFKSMKAVQIVNQVLGNIHGS